MIFKIVFVNQNCDRFRKILDNLGTIGYPSEKLIRDSRVFHITEGTYNNQKVTTGRHLVNL
jgi:alkylation response protein AidB-like acyl-CoA dehydrogenase